MSRDNPWLGITADSQTLEAYGSEKYADIAMADVEADTLAHPLFMADVENGGHCAFAFLPWLGTFGFDFNSNGIFRVIEITELDRTTRA